MNIAFECISCLARQAVEIAEEATPDRGLQEQIILAALTELSRLDFKQTAPEIAYRMHGHAKRITGNLDPYRLLKAGYNKTAETIAKALLDEDRIFGSEDPFDTACRLAIAGNIIDFSVGLELKTEDILRSVEESLQKPIFGSGSKALKKAAEKADKILYLADNSGEIVFDRFLIEQLQRHKVTLAVKGGPIVNDATMEDAVAAGLTELVTVIDNGFDAQGTLLDYCSESFRAIFEESDLIISKGQANFETLSNRQDKQIFFLMRAKCGSVAKALGCETMAFVAQENRMTDVR